MTDCDPNKANPTVQELYYNLDHKPPIGDVSAQKAQGRALILADIRAKAEKGQKAVWDMRFFRVFLEGADPYDAAAHARYGVKDHKIPDLIQRWAQENGCQAEVQTYCIWFRCADPPAEPEEYPF